MLFRSSTKDKVLLMASKKTYELDEVGVMAPDQRKVDSLQAGEVGYLAASIKAVADARVGDTFSASQGYSSRSCWSSHWL